MHGPRGEDNPSYPRMVNNRCNKNFPFCFSNETKINVRGYPQHVSRMVAL